LIFKQVAKQKEASSAMDCIKKQNRKVNHNK